MCKNAKSVGIMSHINPDGDGFCASLALSHILHKHSIESRIVVDEPVFTKFDYLMSAIMDSSGKLPRENTIVGFRPEMRFDLLIILDCNSYSRLGDRATLLEYAQQVILLDHHESEGSTISAGVSYIDTTHVSTGVILFQIFGDEIALFEPADRKYIADCLYTTILNDTNNFSNANTNPESYEVSATLCAWGMKPKDMYDAFFQSFTPDEMRYLGNVLSTIETLRDGRILFMHSSLDMLHRNNLETDNLQNTTRWVQGVKGLDAIIYAREEQPGSFRISLRSLKLNVNNIAASFGGGGHKNASGCGIMGTFSEVRQMILEAVSKSLDEFDASLS
ncbi:MAG: DHH family phosphoesterase [Candidatus Cloacimonadaceae bacterium]|nr:DHH family phosphoesterase [Candidatus Cloacimonadaceae bacterium]